MKRFFAILICVLPTFAQTTKGFNSDSAQIITAAGNTSLSPEEVVALKQAIQAAQHAATVAEAANAEFQSVRKKIAANHNAPAAGPYQIVTDFSTTIDQVPPPAPPPIEVWKKVADEGDVVLVKAGTIVRYGAPKGSPNSYGGVTSADAWTQSVAFLEDTTLTVDNTSFGPDPVVGTIKELDMLGTAGGVARTTAK